MVAWVGFTVSLLLHLFKTLSPAAVSSRISQLLAIQAEAIPEAWGGEEEPARILRGLELVRKMDEAFMFCQPVDLEQVPSYCTLVPFPTDLSTITERLRNGLYRWVGGRGWGRGRGERGGEREGRVVGWGED